MGSESLAQIRGETQTLFVQARLSDWLAKLREDCKAVVLDASEKTLLHADADAWAAQLAREFFVDPVVLDSDRIEAEDLGEIQVDVSKDRARAISDPSRPFLVPGRKVVVHLPFSGDGTLLRVHGSQMSMNPPRAAIGEGEVLLTFEYPSDRRPAIKDETDRLVAAIDRYVGWQRTEIERHNAELAAFARDVIEHRRQRVLADRDHLDGLGIPVRAADSAPTTYAAPGIARRPSPIQKRTASPDTVVPMHPTLVGEFYEHILSVVGAMARGMERNPGDYASWTEEQLRDSLLVMLNSHYEGQATGETFNGSGKTDIIVRSEDRNVFVAECKWWSGATALAASERAEPSALDQLLSYATWRDAKLALVVFVGRQGIDRVLAAAKDALAAHPAFERWTQSRREGELCCRVRMSGDEDRSADLAVVFVHLPRP